MKKICFSLSLLALSASAQSYQFPESPFQTFIGGSYAFAMDGSSSLSDINNADGVQGEYLWSFEIGTRYQHQSRLTSTFSFEVLGTYFQETESYNDGFYSESLNLKAQNIGLFGNYRIGYDLNSRLSVYGGGGIGTVFTHLEGAYTAQLVTSSPASGYSERNSNNYTTFAYQAVAGVEVRPLSKLALFVQCRYVSGSDLDIDGESVKAIDGSFIDVGARLFF